MSLPLPLPSDDAPDPAARRRGFVLYVGVDETNGGSPAELAEAAELLRELAEDLLPSAETYTALSLAPGGSRDVGGVRDRLAHLRPLPGPDE